MTPPLNLRRLLIPEELIDRNANRLKRDLRRLYRVYRLGWVSKVECLVQGSSVVRRSGANMSLAVKAYVERFGLVFDGGDTGFFEEAVEEAVARWRRCVEDFEHKTVRVSADVGVCSCSEHHVLAAKSVDYWLTPVGLTRRMDGLAQDLSFQVVGAALRVVAARNGLRWLYWQTEGDDSVCPVCNAAAHGGRDGYYRVSWFMPLMPKHQGCRCRWVLLFYNPFPFRW
jgi:hypothetical protein